MAGPFVIVRQKKVIFDYSALYCETPEEVLKSALFEEIVRRFVEKHAGLGDSIFAYLSYAFGWTKKENLYRELIRFFRLVFSYTAEEVASLNEQYRVALSEREALAEVVEELYNYWRGFERYFYIKAPEARTTSAREGIHHAQFIRANEHLKSLVLYVYRRISENVTGKNPHAYRQLPAGANMGILIERLPWNCPERYSILREIPFVRLSLMEPPLILYPEMNKRRGQFLEIQDLPEEVFQIEPSEFLCFPAKVGELTAFVFFHQDFISLGLSLSNLFEIADASDILNKRPDLILIFGTPAPLPEPTVFYDDEENSILIGAVHHCPEVDYFGYFKKMVLTLHNIVMLKRGRLPLHGAMVCLKLKGGERANVVLVGDSGAGKSETLEALRLLAKEEICEKKIIFDDMGSLGKDPSGRVLGYGTEIGAFVRLDDLEPGYAYEEIDRSIFMNPDKTNARLVIPITRFHHIVKGYPVDILLYANNYEQVDREHPTIEFFDDIETAMEVFRSGARLAKGTTDEKGLVHTYFANPFGPPQRRQLHEKIARQFFEDMFSQGVLIGHIRTRLGIEGYEQKGPLEAAKALFEVIRTRMVR